MINRSFEAGACNIFDKIPDNLPEELFQVLAESRSTRIERIISKGHTTPAGKWYDQSQTEFVIVLRGEASIEFEDVTIHLKAGDYLTIPAHSRHRVSWTPEKTETVWLAVHMD